MLLEQIPENRLWRCRTLGRQLLLSSEFVKLSGVGAQSLGSFSLKGVAAKQEIFVPAKAEPSG
jgi:adenylate cyclase